MTLDEMKTRIEQLEARIARLERPESCSTIEEMKYDVETMSLFPFCRKHRHHFGSLGETKRYWDAAQLKVTREELWWM